MKKKLINTLNSLPWLPWIYQFINQNSEIIYIWKSINLKNRVNSYFSLKAKLNFAKKNMIKQIEDIKIIITNNETESLILETTLIKKYKPKYNVLMKDDKNYIYIKITNEIFPKIIKTRIKNKSWTYFWPYISTSYVNNVLKFLKKQFWYRTCNLSFLKKDKKINLKSNIKVPCLDYYIKRCSWPCLLKNENIKKYKQSIDDIKLFLSWHSDKIIKDLETKMKNDAKNLDFEKAQIKYELIKSIKNMQENQIIIDSIKDNYDIINYIEKYKKVYIWVIKIRNSKITWFFNYEIKAKLNENIKDLIKIFIERKIAENLVKRKKIKFITTIDIKIKDQIIETPKIWIKVKLLELCYKNLYEYAYKKYINSLSKKQFTKKTMINLLETLSLKQINKDIIFECNDISHLSGNYIVASRSVIKNWKKDKSLYRKFKIKTLKEQKIDDFWALKEIIERRLKEIVKTSNIPDLIIIDWWIWQLNSVLKIVNNFWHKDLFSKLQIISIAKKEEEIFIPNNKKSILFKKDDEKLRLIQQIRDEAHRFAITFNRNKRIKSLKKNILEQLPGFGPITRKKILNLYGNIDNLKNIDKKDLNKILNKTQIETLDNHGLI